MIAASLELDVRPVDEVADHAGQEHLAWPCQRGYAPADVHGYTCEVVTSRLALSRVQTGDELNRAATRAMFGSSIPTSRWLTKPGTNTMSMGPSPKT